MKPLSKKEQIIFKAADEFADSGFEGASLDDIAKKAKVAKGTIFYHFKNKKDLFEAVLEEGVKRFDQRIEEETAKLKQANEKILCIIRIEKEIIKNYEKFFTIFLGELVKKAYRFHKIEEVINEGKKEGIFRTDIDTETMATSLFWLTAMTTINGKIEGQGEVILRGIGK